MTRAFPLRPAQTTAWIVADAAMQPALRTDVCGMPHVLRIAADLVHAGATAITVIWRGDSPPELSDLARDPRLRGAAFTVATEPPPGNDAVIVVRADRICHRDLPKLCAAAWRGSSAELVTIAGAEHDAVAAATRTRAHALLDHWNLDGETAAPPYLAFTAAAPDARSLRHAEKRLVWSLRKQSQGLAAYWLNRHISLRVTRALMRTGIAANQVTVFCFLLALVGGIVIGQGGYLAGVVGMLLVNLGSVLDGVDGELARLKYGSSQLGAWLDTLADDFGNVAYITGIGWSLHLAGVAWAGPLAMTALACFAMTQCTQYVLIKKVYRSGDLAAIPWAFQSTDFLTAKPRTLGGRLKTTLPKLLKRDFALTLFVAFAAVGRLDWILLVFSAGAIGFALSFTVQLARNLNGILRELRGDR